MVSPAMAAISKNAFAIPTIAGLSSENRNLGMGEIPHTQRNYFWLKFEP